MEKFTITQARAMFAEQKSEQMRKFLQMAIAYRDAIKEAIVAGKTCLVLYEAVPDEVQQILKDDGFTVVPESYRNEFSTTFSGWADPR